MGYLYGETMLPAHPSQHRQYTGVRPGVEGIIALGDCLRNGPVCAEHMTRPGTGGLRQGPALAGGHT